MICLADLRKKALHHGEMRSEMWQKDKRWSDHFLPEIKSILGLHLIGEPPIEEDQERNTACRVRRNHYLLRYGDEFTIRSNRPSGTKTELTKIIEGWGNYFFYAFADENESRLQKWLLGDLSAFRLWYMRQLINSHLGNYPGTKRNNQDNSSDFCAFKYTDIPNFIKASKSG